MGLKLALQSKVLMAPALAAGKNFAVARDEGAREKFRTPQKKFCCADASSRRLGTGRSVGCFPRCAGVRAGRAVCEVAIAAHPSAPRTLQLQLRYLTGKKLRVSILREGKKSFAKFSTRRKILC
jgi:hypothetical protein